MFILDSGLHFAQRMRLTWCRGSLTRKVAAVFEQFRACIRALNTPEIKLAYFLPINFPCELIQFFNGNTVSYENGYRLHNAVVESQEDSLQVVLWWETPDNVFNSALGYSIQIFWVDEKVGQTDWLIESPVTKTAVATHQLPPGSYAVHLIMYSTDDIKTVGGRRKDTDAFSAERRACPL